MPQDNGDILLDVCFQVHYEIVGLNTSRALAPAMAPSLWMTSSVLAGAVLTSMNALAATAWPPILWRIYQLEVTPDPISI